MPREFKPRRCPGQRRRLSRLSGLLPLPQVTDGRRVLRAANGVPMLQQITATGCSGGCALLA